MSFSYKEENILDSRERYQERGRDLLYNVSYSYKEENNLDSRERYQEWGKRLIK